MSDLISRADAIEAVCNAQCELDVPHYPQCDQVKYCDEIKALLALPSADRPKGKWIKKQVFNPELDKYVPLIECSVCGYEPYYGGSESKFNYCANCGADMRGETR